MVPQGLLLLVLCILCAEITSVQTGAVETQHWQSVSAACACVCSGEVEMQAAHSQLQHCQRSISGAGRGQLAEICGLSWI